MEINKTAAIFKTQTISNSTETNIAKPNIKQNKVDIQVNDAKMIDEANNKLNKMDDVDLDKVQQIKQAISEGKITINLASLAKAISDEHLLGTGKYE